MGGHIFEAPMNFILFITMERDLSFKGWILNRIEI